MRRARSVDSRSSTSPGSTTTLISRPACIANTLVTPGKADASSSRRSRRRTYDSSTSRRAPGRAAETASAACTRMAVSVRGSTSLWWASMPCTTPASSPKRRPISAPTRAWEPPTSWLTALPTSWRNAARFGSAGSIPNSAASISAMRADSTRWLSTFWP